MEAAVSATGRDACSKHRRKLHAALCVDFQLSLDSGVFVSNGKKKLHYASAYLLLFAVVSDIAIFVLKSDVKLQLTN